MNQISLAEYWEQIGTAIEQERYREAVAHGRHVLEQYPKSVQAYWLLGKAMLEAGDDEHATDMFQRVLSADPEHMLAWVGLSEVARRQGELETAAWYLERAFELATENEMVAEELRGLYGELRGHEPERLQLTQGALARLYLRGDLLWRAIGELRKVLDEHPDRADLKVALAEALWRSGQRLEASRVCQEVLDEKPYNLKANLILGEIWTSSGREEGEFYLERAEAVDPQNQVAQEMFGTASPLPLQEPQIIPLDYEAAAEEEESAWTVEPEGLAPAQETELSEPQERDRTSIQIPQWLRGIAAKVTRAGPDEEIVAEEKVPDHPREDLDQPLTEEPAAVEEMAEETAPERLEEPEDEVELPEPHEEGIPFEREEEIPAWLAGFRPDAAEEPAGFEAEEAEEEEKEEEEEKPARAEIPAWLRDLAPPEAEPSDVPSPDALAALLEEVPDAEEPEEAADLPAWLESEAVPSGDDALAWLEQLTEGGEDEFLAQAEPQSEAPMAEVIGRPDLAPEEDLEELEEPSEELEVEEATLEAKEMVAPEETPPEEFKLEGELPAWLESESMPSSEESLAWLEQLTEVEREQLPARADAESETRMAEMMGRPELAPGEAAEELEEPAEEPAEEEVFGWTAFAEAAPDEEVEAAEQAPPAEEPETMAAPEEAQVTAEQVEEAPSEEAPSVEELEEVVPPVEAELLPEAEKPEEVPVLEETTPTGEPEAPAEEERVPEREEVVPAEETAWAEALEREPPAEEAVPGVEARRVHEEVPTMPEREPEMVAREEPEAVQETFEPALTAEEAIAPAAAVDRPPIENLERFIATQRAYAEEHSEDHKAWLDLGRVLWQAERREEAIDTYDRLIPRGELSDEIIADLEDYAEQWPGLSLQQALGDAYMQADRLQDALDTYRRALASL